MELGRLDGQFNSYLILGKSLNLFVPWFLSLRTVVKFKSNNES
jgi:hypothetical protein